MKKQFLAAAVMVLLPLTASASEVGMGNLIITGSAPTVGGYLGDYDITPGSYSKTKDQEIKIATNEVFCISDDPLANDGKSLEYTFYTSDALLTRYKSTIPFSSTSTLNYVTWVANWSTTATSYTYKDWRGNDQTVTGQEEVKALGQAAIWTALGVQTSPTEYGIMNALYSAAGAAAQDDYIDQWLVAINGTLDSLDCHDNGGSQDFLVKASPVPVPSTLLLLGSGLTGLVAAGRRRKQR